MIRAMIVPAAVALFAAGCVGEPTRDRERVQSALQQLDTEGYAATEKCLSTYDYDTVEVLDEQHVLFRGSGDHEIWLNQLRQRCPGLREDDTLAFDVRSNRVCSLDTVTVVSHFIFWRRSGPSCALGEFHQLTEAQATLIREAT